NESFTGTVKLCRLVKPVPSAPTLNTVPAPERPPALAVPYRVLFDRVTPPNGLAPSLPPVKLCAAMKPPPLASIANTVPRPHPPPYVAVPYKVPPDQLKPPDGFAPSVLVAAGPETGANV